MGCFTIIIRSIEEIDACRERRIHDFKRLFFIIIIAENS